MKPQSPSVRYRGHLTGCLGNVKCVHDLPEAKTISVTVFVCTVFSSRVYCVLLLRRTCSRSIVCLMYIHSSTCILGDTAVETKSNKSCRRNKITHQNFLFFFEVNLSAVHFRSCRFISIEKNRK